MADSAKRAKKALARLAALHPKLIDLGLERSFALLQKLGNPHLHLPPTIHVAGTNGKGSVIAFLRALAEAAASPRMSIALRIYAGLTNASDWPARLLMMRRLLTSRGSSAQRHPAGDFFEVTTPPRCWRFRGIRLIYYVLKPTWRGVDLTNVLTAPLATIITPIARDHEHFLGTSLTGIAEQKAGIMRSGILASAPPNPLRLPQPCRLR